MRCHFNARREYVFENLALFAVFLPPRPSRLYYGFTHLRTNIQLRVGHSFTIALVERSGESKAITIRNDRISRM